MGGVPVVAVTFPPHPVMTRSVSKMNSVNNIRNPDFKGLLLLLKNVLASKCLLGGYQKTRSDPINL